MDIGTGTKENRPFHMHHSQNTERVTSPNLGTRQVTALESGMLMSPPPEETLRNAYTGLAKRTSREGNTTSSIQSRSQGLSPVTNRSLNQANRKRTRPSPETVSQPSTIEEMPSESQINWAQYTPNPRLRKQKKRDADNAMSSPSRKPSKPPSYSKNPHADYLPVASTSRASSRRSMTPIPPYDPPSERFTPPREIILSPVHQTLKSPGARTQTQVKPNSNSSTQGKSKVRTKRVGQVEKPASVVAKITRIKTEPPEVDLTAPLPPASPSDDPILLVGPPVERSPLKKSMLGNEDESMLVDFVMETEITGSSKANKDAVERGREQGRGQVPRDVFDFDGEDAGGDNLFTFDASMEPLNDVGFNSDSDDERPQTPSLTMRTIPMFKNARSPTTDTTTLVHTPIHRENTSFTALNDINDEFSDDDDIQSEGEGDYTGKFKTIVVPTKGDNNDGVGRSPTERSDRNGDWVEGREKRKGRRISHSSPHPRRLSGEGWRSMLADDEDTEDSEIEEVDGEKVGGGEESMEQQSRVEDIGEGPPIVHQHEHEQGQTQAQEDDLGQGNESGFNLEPELEGVDDASGWDTVGDVGSRSKGRRLTLSEIEAMRFGSGAQSIDDNGVDDTLEANATGIVDSTVDSIDGSSEEEDDAETSGAREDGEENVEVFEGDGIMHEGERSLPKEQDHSELYHDDRRSHGLAGANGQIQSDRDYSGIKTDESLNQREVCNAVVFQRHESTQQIGANPEAVGMLHEKDTVATLSGRADDTNLHPQGQFDSNEHSKVHSSANEAVETYTFTRARGRTSLTLERGAPVAEEDTDVQTDEDDEDEGDRVLQDALPDVVKIVSSDAKAAARAAAILKLHDYDMVARRTRQNRPQSLEERMNRMRRKTVVPEGVSKAYSPSVTFRRRTFAVSSDVTELDSVAQERTLPELLQEAEQELIREGTPLRTPQSLRIRSAGGYNTPTTSTAAAGDQSLFKIPQLPPGPRAWTKGDWKWLDSCFTDVRLQMAEKRGSGEGNLPGVEEISFEDVMERFVELMGGMEVVESFGTDWTRDKILQRIRALCKKQRSGRGAPSTPQALARIRQGSVALTASPASTTGSMIVPDFTPTPAERVWKFGVGTSDQRQPRIPAVLFGPRYAHLQQEVPVRSVLGSADEKGKGKEKEEMADTSGDVFTDNGVDQDDEEEEESELEDDEDGTGEWEEDEEHNGEGSYEEGHEQEFIPPPSPATSTVGRSLSYISSWFRPASSRASTPQPPKNNLKSRGPQLPALPIPPPSLLRKPRAPINTPAKAPLPKSKHPKELVSLNPAPRRPRASTKGKKRKPKRMVELVHLPEEVVEKGKAKEEKVPESLMAVRRRSSATSVRDMVKGFEELERRQSGEGVTGNGRDTKGKGVEGKKMEGGVKPRWRF